MNTKTTELHIENSEIKLQAPTLFLERVSDGVPVPAYATAGAAGFDLCAARWAEAPGKDPQDFPADGSIILAPGQRITIHTGWKIQAQYPWALSLLARSGKSCKEGVRLANCVGLIDSDYTGELLAVMHNDSQANQTIKYLERVAQAKLTLAPQAQFIETTLSQTVRGDGGFASTGS